MTLAVSSWCWHEPYYRGSWSLLDLPAAATEAGIRQIEANDFMLPPPRFSRLRQPVLRLLPGAPAPLWRYSRHTLRQLRGAVEREGISLLAWTVNSDFTVPWYQWPAQQLYLLRGLAAARLLGAEFLRVNFGGTPETALRRDQVTVARLAAFVQAASARHPPLQITVENHWGISSDLERHLTLFDAVRERLPASLQAKFGCCFDPGNVPDEPGREQWWQGLARRANHYHFKTTAFDEEGNDNGLPHARLLALLDSAAYQGAVTVEFQGNGNPLVGVRQSLTLYRQLHSREEPGAGRRNST